VKTIRYAIGRGIRLTFEASTRGQCVFRVPNLVGTPTGERDVRLDAVTTQRHPGGRDSALVASERNSSHLKTLSGASQRYSYKLFRRAEARLNN